MFEKILEIPMFKAKPREECEVRRGLGQSGSSAAVGNDPPWNLSVAAQAAGQVHLGCCAVQLLPLIHAGLSAPSAM
jgi:hypothetical protein